MPTTWSPTDKNPGVTLSAGNLTASTSGDGGAFTNARGSEGKSSGKHYFEWVRGSSPFTNVGIGLANASASLSDFLGNNTDSIAWYSAGPGYSNGSFVTMPGAYAQGEVCMCAFDRDANKIWFGKNGVWTGDPVAGTGGYVVAIPGSWFPAYSSNRTDSVTARFTAASQSYSPPTGYVAWDASAATTTTPGNASQGQAATSSALAAKSVVVPADSGQAQLSSAPGLTTRSSAAPATTGQSQAASMPAVAAKSAVLPAGGGQSQVSTSPALEAKSAATPDSGTQAQASASPAVTVKSAVAPADGTQAQAASSAALGSVSVVALDGAAQTQTASSPSLAASGALVPVSGTQGQAATSPAVSARHVVTPGSGSQAQSATGATIIFFPPLGGVTPRVRRAVAVGSGARQVSASSSARSALAGGWRRAS